MLCARRWRDAGSAGRVRCWQVQWPSGPGPKTGQQKVQLYLGIIFIYGSSQQNYIINKEEQNKILKRNLFYLGVIWLVDRKQIQDCPFKRKFHNYSHTIGAFQQIIWQFTIIICFPYPWVENVARSRTEHVLSREKTTSRCLKVYCMYFMALYLYSTENTTGIQVDHVFICMKTTLTYLKVSYANF